MLSTIVQHVSLSATTYIHQVVPSFPEITVGNYTDGLSQLGLNTSRDRNHQTDQLLLDSSDLVQMKFVVAIFIRPVSLNEVLEAQSAGKPGVVGIGSGSGDVKERQREAGFLLFLTKSKLG